MLDETSDSSEDSVNGSDSTDGSGKRGGFDSVDGRLLFPIRSVSEEYNSEGNFKSNCSLVALL